MQEDLGLGQIIQGDTKTRDAVHVAVVPVVAGHDLNPGDHVGLLKGSRDRVVRVKYAGQGDNYRARDNVEPLGVVDPFLTAEVQQEERFWLWLYPGTVTSLRHAWTHPAFPPPPEAGEAAQAATTPTPGPAAKAPKAYVWVTLFAQRIGQSYDSLMEAAGAWLKDQYYTPDNSESYKDVTGDEWREFWDHFEALTGIKQTVDRKSDCPFTCSC